MNQRAGDIICMRKISEYLVRSFFLKYVVPQVSNIHMYTRESRLFIALIYGELSKITAFIKSYMILAHSRIYLAEYLTISLSF